ncbi:hypothetical protein [Cohnella massiliensis]|uniref:hypothetical protein n=1 Tax=Cohnella massiliensis TaxID=1816691 RepID=UPI0009BC6ADB|nr:hypothetical protein [Cohnella massiliensis]
MNAASIVTADLAPRTDSGKIFTFFMSSRESESALASFITWPKAFISHPAPKAKKRKKKPPAKAAEGEVATERGE